MANEKHMESLCRPQAVFELKGRVTRGVLSSEIRFDTDTEKAVASVFHLRYNLSEKDLTRGGKQIFKYSISFIIFKSIFFRSYRVSLFQIFSFYCHQPIYLYT